MEKRRLEAEWSQVASVRGDAVLLVFVYSGMLRGGQTVPAETCSTFRIFVTLCTFDIFPLKM